MKKGLSGWQRVNRNMQPVMPENPSRWSLLLYKLGLQESEVESALKDPKGRDLRRWIERHSHTAYVPEKILSLIGIESRWLA